MKNYIIILAVILVSSSVYSQTEEIIIEDLLGKRSYLTIGYLRINPGTNSGLNTTIKPQNGILIGYNYNIATLVDFKNGRINLGGALNFGFAYSKNTTYDQGYSSDTTIQYTTIQNRTNTYTGIADLFSLNATIECLVPISKNNSVELNLALTFLNIGGTVTYFESPGTAYSKNYIYSVNFLPFYIQPSAKMRLGNFAFGMGLLFNPFNFIEYNGTSKNYYGKSIAGFKKNESMFNRYAINLFLNF